MTFIRRYWFGACLSLLFVFFIVLAVLILISPRQDLEGRGFTRCSQNMVEDLWHCEQKISCGIGAIVSNNWCITKVVGKGIVLWLEGKQQRPWSNYIFEPKTYLSKIVDEQERQEYLATHPDVKEEMEHLHRLRKDLENEEATKVDVPWTQE